LNHIIPKTFFQTTDLPYSRKYDAFKESIGIMFDVSEVQKDERQFDAWIKSQLIGEMLLVECETVGQRFLRTSSMIARDSIDHLLIQIFYVGATVRAERSEERICNRGRILILDASKTWDAINTDFRNLTLVIPRRLIINDIANIDKHHGRIIDTKDNPFAEVLYDHLLSLDVTCENMPSIDVSIFVRPSIDLVAATLNYQDETDGDFFSSNRSSFQLGMRFRIKKFLDVNIGNPHLSVKVIEDEFKLSNKYLTQLFPNEGGVLAYINARRLELSFKRLVLEQNRKDTIEKVAFDLGFKSLANFNQFFKEHFSIAPQDIFSNDPQLSSILKTSEVQEGRWEDWFRSL
jgi:AraC-like DNA-binding protein